MAQATFHFPRGFLWGTATSGYQVEGNNPTSAWYSWENQPGRIHDGQKSGLACDWWGGRWREDFDRAVETKQNAHRLSIEWSRIQPAPDRWDESALDRYREIVRGLTERGLTPLVTLHHFSDPQWLLEQGGWENERAAELFEVYVRKVVEALKGVTNLWVTINEPNEHAVNGYFTGLFPPGKRNLSIALRVMINLVEGHARAYHAIHTIQPEARVGLAHAYVPFLPTRAWFPGDRMMVWGMDSIFNEFFPQAASSGRLHFLSRRRSIPQAKNTQDYLGLNYYTRSYTKLQLPSRDNLYYDRNYPEGMDLSDHGFMCNDPAGFSVALKWANKFKLPIIITENGIENSKDDLRRRFLVQHLHQLWRAVNFNYPVKGYFHWTLVDNFEWERGWNYRFGLWELDPATQVRRKRPSADLYAAICQENGLSSEMVARYTPHLFEQMFPNR